MNENQLTGGLILSGLIVGQRVENKEWEGKKYSVHSLMISDGERTYTVSQNLKEAETPPAYPVFKRAQVRVQHAMTDKGNIVVRGPVEILNAA